jgi:hypothetical protein
MSGPIAATFGLDAGLAIAAAAAIRAAMVIADGYAAEDERQADISDGRESERQQRRAASLAGRQALADGIAREESRLRRLVSTRDLLAMRLGETATAPAALPARPEATDTPALLAFLEAVRTLNDSLADELAGLSARSAEAVPAADLSALVAAAPTVAQQLAAFEAQLHLSRRVSAAVAAERRAQVERILARAAIAEGAGLPEDLELLAAELMGTLSAERAETLASELRLRVARYNEAATAEAAALVLEQSLKDLGYAVDGIGETLFVEGGVAHFQKAGWNDYFVRLRVDAGRGSLNFNVVRAGTAGEDRRHEDLLAEERWCAEFPRLQATLAARGIAVDVTRMLGAGEVPVQVVPAASLPEQAGEDKRRQITHPKAMQRP